MRTIATFLIIISAALLSGCEGNAVKKDLLTVDFHQGQTLRYKLISTRDIETNWDPGKRGAKVDKSSESVEIVMAYKPVEIQTYGSTTIEGTCESVTAKRKSSKGSQTDAIAYLKDKKFKFTIGPTGKITDDTELRETIQQVGEKAFRPKSKQGRIKEPDLIDDFIAMQWYLWDSIASIQNSVEGVEIGQSWQSKLPIPTSMVLRNTRDVTYTLSEIRQTDTDRIAVINSVYSPAETALKSYPTAYSGRFQMSGPFGFFRMLLRDFKVLRLTGKGEQLFNIDAGRLEQYDQNYKVVLGGASKSKMLNVDPRITIRQKTSLRLIKN